MNVELIQKQPDNESEVILDSSKMMNINEQLINLRELAKYIQANKHLELENKNKFDLDILHRFDGKVIRKIINLLIDEPSERGKNLNIAITILLDLKAVQESNSDVKPVIQKYIDKFTNEYIYTPNGGKDEFERKVKLDTQ